MKDNDVVSRISVNGENEKSPVLNNHLYYHEQYLSMNLFYLIFLRMYDCMVAIATSKFNYQKFSLRIELSNYACRILRKTFKLM